MNITSYQLKNIFKSMFEAIGGESNHDILRLRSLLIVGKNAFKI